MRHFFHILSIFIATKASYNISTETLCFQTGFTNIYTNISSNNYRCGYVECNITNTIPVSGIPTNIVYLDELSMVISSLNQSLGSVCEFNVTNCLIGEYELNPFICGCPVCKGSASCQSGFNRNSEGTCQYTKPTGSNTCRSFTQDIWNSDVYAKESIQTACYQTLSPINCPIAEFIINDNNCSCPTCVPDECSLHEDCESIHGDNNFMCKETWTGPHSKYTECEFCEEKIDLFHDHFTGNLICGMQSCNSTNEFPVINLAEVSYSDLVTFCPSIANCPQDYNVLITNQNCCPACNGSTTTTLQPTRSPTTKSPTTSQPTQSPTTAQPTTRPKDCEIDANCKPDQHPFGTNDSICIKDIKPSCIDFGCGGWCHVKTVCNTSIDCIGVFEYFEDVICYDNICWPCDNINMCTNNTFPTTPPTKLTPSPTRGDYNCEIDSNCQNEYFCELDTCNFCGGWCVSNGTPAPTQQTLFPTTPEYDCNTDDSCDNGYFCELDTCNFCGGWCRQKICSHYTDCEEHTEWCYYNTLSANYTTGICLNCECDDGLRCNELGNCVLDSTPSPIQFIECDNILQCNQGYEYCDFNQGVCKECNCDDDVTCDSLGICDDAQGNSTWRYSLFACICWIFLIFAL